MTLCRTKASIKQAKLQTTYQHFLQYADRPATIVLNPNLSILPAINLDKLNLGAGNRHNSVQFAVVQ